MKTDLINASVVMGGTTANAFMLRGILIVLLGIVFTVNPLLPMLWITIAFGVFFLLGGLWTLLTLGMVPSSRRLFWLIYGCGMLLIGILLIWNPKVAEKIFAYFIALWFLTGGVLGIWDTAQSAAPFSGKLLPLISGLISLFIGFVLFTWPIVGLATMFWAAGLILIVEGFMLIGFSWLLKKKQKTGRSDD